MQGVYIVDTCANKAIRRHGPGRAIDRLLVLCHVLESFEPLIKLRHAVHPASNAPWFFITINYSKLKGIPPKQTIPPSPASNNAMSTVCSWLNTFSSLIALRCGMCPCCWELLASRHNYEEGSKECFSGSGELA